MVSLLFVFLALLWSVAHVFGQAIFTNATCQSTYSWMDNGIGQSPCLVAAYLAGVCNSGQCSIYAIPFNGSYAHSRGYSVNPCECSTALYNLFQACSYCQGGSVDYWSEWTNYCPTAYISKSFPYPVPSATNIPPWALLDPSLLGYWSYSDALAYASSPSASITPYAMTSSSVMSPSISPSPSPSPPLIPAPVPEKRSFDTGAVVGGVIGGMAVLGFLILGAWYIRTISAANRRTTSGGWAIDQGTPHSEQPEPGSPSSPPPGAAVPLLFDPGVTTPMTAKSPSTGQRFGSPGMSIFSAPTPPQTTLELAPPAYASGSDTIH